MDSDLTNEATQGQAAGERAPELMPGDRIEVYRVIRLLGRGGMGEVYEVEHRELGTRHALKVIPSRLASQHGFVERFRREARVMATLTHPGIVHVSDFRVTDGRYWLLMDLVKGVPIAQGEVDQPPSDEETAVLDGAQDREVKTTRSVSLADLAKASDGKLDQVLLADLLIQVLEALAYAHERGTVHRDLKPGNILLDEGDEGMRARISDFGLVRLVGEEWVRSAAARSTTESTLGREDTEAEDASGESTKALLGTYEYMSPEQKSGGEVDARSDLYAMGLMAYRLVTGQRLVTFKPPSHFGPALDPQWDDVIGRALEPDPENRHQSSREMGEAIRPIAEALASAQGQARTSLRERLRRGVLTPVALAAVVLLVLAGVFLLARMDDPSTEGGRSRGRPSRQSFQKRLPAADRDQALLAEAKKLHAANDFTGAIGKLDDLIYRCPETPAKAEAEALKAQCEKALAARKEAEAKVKAAFVGAKVQENAGFLAGAIATLGAVLPYAPEDTGLRAEIARLRKMHYERTTAAQRDQSYRAFMDAGQAAEIRRDWSGAIRAYELVLANKDTGEAKDKLAAARHSLLAGKAKDESDLDKRIELYAQALSHESRPETRTLLAEAQAERKRRQEVAAAKRDFAKWMSQGRESEQAKRWDAAKQCYERARSHALKAGTDEVRQVAEAIVRCRTELGRLDQSRSHVSGAIRRVSGQGKGDFKSIKNALAASSPGDTILVEPGLYKESISLNKEVDVIGTEAGVIVESSQSDCLTMNAKAARVRMLALRALGAQAHKRLYGVRVAAGSLTMENCDITSDSLACVFVSGAASNPTIRKCRIVKGADCGVIFSDGARGTLEDCDISENAGSGVVVLRGADPEVRRCNIRRNRQSGAYVTDKGLGLFDTCDIEGNGFAGLSTREGGAPVVQKSKIRQGKMSGVYVRDNGRGVIEHCDIVANDGCGVEVKTGGSVVIRRCKITNNTYEAVWLREKGSATVTNCDLRENGRGPFDVAEGCVLKRLDNRW